MLHWFRLELKPPVISPVFCLPDTSDADRDFHNEYNPSFITEGDFNDPKQFRTRLRLDIAGYQVLNSFFSNIISLKSNI
jgi:hypothetical protein